MTDEKKWREWWMSDIGTSREVAFPSDPSKWTEPLSGYVRVIEYAAYEKLQSEVSDLEADQKALKSKLEEKDLELDQLQSEVELWRDKHKIVSDSFEKLDEHAQELAAKLQAAEAEIERQISLRKASESVDEEYRAKLQAAEAALNFEHQAKQQPLSEQVLSLTLENANLRTDARRLAEALDRWADEYGDLHEIAREALTPGIRERYLKTRP